MELAKTRFASSGASRSSFGIPACNADRLLDPARWPPGSPTSEQFPLVLIGGGEEELVLGSFWRRRDG
jgi:hypothetical protein